MLREKLELAKRSVCIIWFVHVECGRGKLLSLTVTRTVYILYYLTTTTKLGAYRFSVIYTTEVNETNVIDSGFDFTVNLLKLATG